MEDDIWGLRGWVQAATSAFQCNQSSESRHALAFRHCRPVFSIDGTFLIGKYRGTLLIAISCDANNKLVPLAFALVERENNDSWGWFLRLV
jgi:hypothetical protein